jgi:GDP-L-fucose synthase
MAPQPIKEEHLLTGPLEPTNEWYAIAKITGVKLIEALRIQYNRNYISLMPTNLYGPGDNYDLNTSHVLPAMIRKFHEAKINNKPMVTLWGTGKPLREFLFVDDFSKFVIYALQNNLNESIYNAGSGFEISIKSLAAKIKDITNYKGDIHWDNSKPDGTPRKLMDSKKIKDLINIEPIDLNQGIRITYENYIRTFS